MAAVAQTIAVVDRSGKVVSTSKQLKNVFKEAKSAYLERKAEIAAERRAKEDVELRKAIKAMSIAEKSRSDATRSTRRSHSTRDLELRVQPPTGERHASSSSARSGSPSISPRSPHDHDSTHAGGSHTPRRHRSSAHSSRSVSRSPVLDGERRELTRAHTDMDLALARQPRNLERARTTGAIDMDLAYGEYHPESISPLPVTRQDQQQQELSSLVLKAKMLLDEANCAQHSVKAIVAHLQTNPEAMAAVALTLAEISNIASKMAPGALSAFKVGAPAIFSLLAAPEFLIAVGVGVGITVVMFGGYKIIKKIRAKAAQDKEGGMDEMLEIGGDVNRIEHWRRGIADVETASVATSVEGEFITPTAMASMSHLPIDSRVKDIKSGKKAKKSKRDRSERSEPGSTASSRANSVSHSEAGNRALIKVKKPSPLRRMFHRDDGSSTRS